MPKEIRANLEQVDEQEIERLERELEGTQADEAAKPTAPYRASGAKHSFTAQS